MDMKKEFGDSLSAMLNYGERMAAMNNKDKAKKQMPVIPEEEAKEERKTQFK